MKQKRLIRRKAIRPISLSLLILIALSLACVSPVVVTSQQATPPVAGPTLTAPPRAPLQQAIPTLTLAPQNTAVPVTGSTQIAPGIPSNIFIKLHDQLSPGVVNIDVIISQGGRFGAGAGSGFLIDDQRHIVTNHHVIEGAQQVTVTYYNGFQSDAKVIGTDPDSDLAIIQASQVSEGVHPLKLGDSDNVKVGEWVIAIGNPFRLGGSMTQGIVSATGREIESGVPNYVIPEAIQTDAAINPGNSGGPLLNLSGEVIGVNAQIATDGGTPANTGVGFAIPVNIVRRVAPVLIERGSYQWPWLGVEGTDLNLPIKDANNLTTQQGAYILNVVSNGPADKAGLHGSTGSNPDGIPIGGDVVVGANGKPVNSFSDLLDEVFFSSPGEKINLTILRNGQRQQVIATLEPRPANAPVPQNPFSSQP